MPIRPEHRWLYPIDWPKLSRIVRFRRARGRCERCARPHGREVPHLGDGRWWDEEKNRWRDEQGRRVRGLPRPGRERVLQPALLEDGYVRAAHRVTRVVLASAHLDHDPGNNSFRNLRALCQRCHLAHDRRAHRRRRWATMFRRRALGDLSLWRVSLTEKRSAERGRVSTRERALQVLVRGVIGTSTVLRSVAAGVTDLESFDRLGSAVVGVLTVPPVLLAFAHYRETQKTTRGNGEPRILVTVEPERCFGSFDLVSENAGRGGCEPPTSHHVHGCVAGIAAGETRVG